MSDDLDLDAIETRTNAATQGPWFLHGKRLDYEDLYVWHVVNQEAESPYHPVAQQLAEGYGIGLVCAMTGDGTEADRAFIAAARSDVPALVAEVRKLRARVAELEDDRSNSTFNSLTQRW